MLSRDQLWLALCLIALTLTSACGPSDEPASNGTRKDDDADSSTKVSKMFVDATEELGLNFVHNLTLKGGFSLEEITGAGLGIFDANGDGLLDVFCVESGSVEKGVADKLFVQGADGKFTPKKDAGFQPAFSTGVAAGDVDNDGDIDLWVGAVGRDRLYLNDGAGRFSEVGEQFGLSDSGFSTSIAMFDFNLDGYLDVFVCRLAILVDPPPECILASGKLDYCHPTVYKNTSSQLWMNKGGKQFINVSSQAGIGAKNSYGLGVIADDFNNDGWPDLYVANDSVPNFMWINKKDGTFEEVGLMSGTSVNSLGAPEGSMGLAVGDIDGNGHPDIFTTNVRRESNTLYLGGEGLNFTDGTAIVGLAAPSLPYTGWGTAFFDPDNDGDFDLLLVNGSVARSDPPFPGARKGTVWEYYAERNLFFENVGSGRLKAAHEKAGDVCDWAANHRAMLAVDLNGDGGEDVVTNALSEETRIYRNQAKDRGNWIKVEVFDGQFNRYAIGAIVKIFAKGLTARGIVTSATSYMATCVAPLQFGLGDRTEVDRIEVIFPGGEKQTFPGGKHGTTLKLTRQRK